MSNGLHLSLEEILELIREGEEISKGPDVFWREPDNAKDGIGEGQGRTTNFAALEFAYSNPFTTS